MSKALRIGEKKQDILSYEPQIWSTADTLRGSVTSKEHLYPGYMMPFFALMMVESRLIRAYDKVSRDPELLTEEDRIEEIKQTVGFYNSMVIEEKITLSELAQNDKHFNTEFDRYLKSFDYELQQLLGIINGKDEDNLNIYSKISSLKDKKVLLTWIAKWSNIDFSPYDNSDITTLEEQIKRRWADMSAETAGQQYTPSDIIDLIAELCGLCDINLSEFTKIYDMTCGGGNMLFGVEDKLKRIHPTIKVETYGQELEGALYSLARIESKFRKDSTIVQGNTLNNDRIPGVFMDFIVANPPYGVDWKDISKDIEDDQTGRYKAGKPSVSDGQLLFIQHAISKLNNTGKAFIVLNGSPLFSGDAGSGESNIRKWILDNDYLEALIQLPTNEFFNTDITTYIWCLNKNKSQDRKDKILCINAEAEFIKMKKNKGDKSKEISPEKAKKIAQLYKNFTVSEISQIKSKYDFYFNKQVLSKIQKDNAYGAFNHGQSESILTNVHNLAIVNKYTNVPRVSMDLVNSNFCSKEDATQLNEQFKSFNKEEEYIVVYLNMDNRLISYTMDENQCIIKNENNKIENLGCGAINFKANYKKQTKKEAEKLQYIITISASWIKDDEKIEYSPFVNENEENIRNFLKKWISLSTDEYKLLNNTIGVEINFNTIFSNKIEVRDTKDILKDMVEVDEKIMQINEEHTLQNLITKGLNPAVPMKKSNIEWIGEIPSHWEVKRVGDFFTSPKVITQPGRTDVLSLTLNGVIEKDLENIKGLNPESYDTYQIFKKDDLVFKLIDLENYQTSRVGKVWKDGIMSSAYIRLSKKGDINIPYFYYQFFDLYKRGIFNILGGNGVRSAINRGDLLKMKIVVPPENEQKEIADFLEKEFKNIDRKKELINIKINLLKEYQQALMYEAVTGKI
jgi:type I restriction enzyme M protein